VPGAQLVPLGSLAARVDELPRDDRVYVICASGDRSRTASAALAAAGRDAISVSGGIRAWVASGGPVVRGLRDVVEIVAIDTPSRVIAVIWCMRSWWIRNVISTGSWRRWKTAVCG
jgi:rhodanese-like protein